MAGRLVFEEHRIVAVSANLGVAAVIAVVVAVAVVVVAVAAAAAVAFAVAAAAVFVFVFVAAVAVAVAVASFLHAVALGVIAEEETANLTTELSVNEPVDLPSFRCQHPPRRNLPTPLVPGGFEYPFHLYHLCPLPHRHLFFPMVLEHHEYHNQTYAPTLQSSASVSSCYGVFPKMLLTP